MKMRFKVGISIFCTTWLIAACEKFDEIPGGDKDGDIETKFIFSRNCIDAG